MSFGLRMFAFIQKRDVIVVKKESLRNAIYQCGICPGGVSVHFLGKATEECCCESCGQVYLVVVTRRIE